ncbi:MAG: serine hydrolase domain-containing protein [Pseudomonadota bacterium]
MRLAILLYIGFSLISIAMAQPNAAAATTDPIETPATIEIAPSTRTLPGLEAFFDGAVGALLKANDVPGVTISVVYDGEIAFVKGYGYADVARVKPVSGDTTLFRAASISKTFTWTAVMQLVEQGKLDLDTDVNEYLTQFQIPETYSKPVTLRHILSHTAGFEDGMIGYFFRRREKDLLSLPVALERFMPARVRAPGTYYAYSNWATSLAGLVIANQSGVDFDQYMEENIFEPLSMSHSTFREPVPAAIADGQSANFQREQGDYVDDGFEYIHDFGPAPAFRRPHKTWRNSCWRTSMTAPMAAGVS